ncbi:ATPase, AAA-type, CDC48 [Ostreococcus tauri]|uniref:ATPase, AAA-type, CDC48 n=1 Tax=Ostreococcus tauri TaxID=70448 RepID=A0A090M742_OSTTA|nr:ATPase, AAA-type, CDC48 [Ostreococcus tauri]CEG00917.1 ATPase, AAA-type, CDC48 [Ostreococcus tauri]|eukprot:XP_022840667.1 ATPase, AAA-type, CDC48 [Ostreococcus tauri]
MYRQLHEGTFPLGNRHERREPEFNHTQPTLAMLRLPNLIIVTLDVHEFQRADLLHSLFLDVELIVGKLQATWVGFQVSVRPGAGRKHCLRAETIARVVKISSRRTDRLMFCTNTTRIVLRTKTNPRRYTKHHDVYFERYRNCYDEIKTSIAFWGLSIKFQLRNQYQFLFLNVPHNFLAWLGLKLQEDRSMQMQRLSCRVIFLMRKQINFQLLLKNMFNRTVGSDLILVLEDIDLLVNNAFDLHGFMATISEVSTFYVQHDGCKFTFPGRNTFIVGTANDKISYPILRQYFSREIQVLTHSVMRKHKKRGVDALYTSCARIRESLLIRGHDVRTESAKLQPDRILAGRSHFSWNDVGGLSHIKHALNDMIKLPLSYPKLFHKFSKGALLYGPPGTGKTLIAKVVSAESGLCFFNIKGPELLGMYVGESERKVRELFKRAKESAPALIFFDEFDSLSMVPSAAGLTSRINSQIILELDSLQNTQVFILAASNRVELVDPALLRSGRIDRVLHIPFHADLRSRTETFEALTRNFKFDGQISMAEIAKVYQYSSGAQIYARCARAWIKAARRGINELSEVAVKLEDFY